MSDVAERLERSLKSVLISALLASRADVLATALRAGEHLDDAGLPPWTLRCGPGVVEYLRPGSRCAASPSRWTFAGPIAGGS